MGEQEMFDIQISGQDLNIVRRITGDQLALVTSIIFASEKVSAPLSVSSLAKEQGINVAVSNKPQSLREYLDAAGANTKVEIITTIVSYLIDVVNQDDVGKEEILDSFGKAREQLPANFSRDFNAALASGYIAECRNPKGRYYVTKSGTDAVKSGFK